MTRKLTEAQGKYLVKLARTTIENKLSGNETKVPKHAAALDEEKGVFVTLTKHGELRGCIGHPYPDGKLVNSVVDSAISAAFRDPRFRPVTKDELKDIHIEVTVLTVPEEMDKSKLPGAIEIGKHGLVIKKGWNSGIFLPQVSVEQGWDALDFLDDLCVKAGLRPGQWMEKDAKIFSFEGQIFAEGR